MSDYNSSLPIRTEAAGDVQVKIVDATVTSQQLKVEADGSINTNISATNLDIRDLVFATDKVDVSGSSVALDAPTLAALESITVQNGSGGSAVNIQDGGNSITVDGTVELGATTLAALESITVQNGAGVAAVNIQDGGNSITVDGSVTVSATDLDVRDLVFATDKVDVSGSTVALDAPTLAALESITVQNGAGGSAVNIQDGGNSITVDGSVTVSATDLDIRDLTHVSDSIKVGDGTDFLAVNSDGSINVKISDASPGTAVNSYNTAAAVAAAASSTHTYTSTGNFYLSQIEASASGKMKIEVQVNSVTKFVQFNSTAETNMSIILSQPILATTGQTVTVIRTNRDNQSQDVYSTILGYNE